MGYSKKSIALHLQTRGKIEIRSKVSIKKKSAGELQTSKNIIKNQHTFTALFYKISIMAMNMYVC